MTFGAGPLPCYKAVKRICEEAKAFPFDEINGYTDQDLRPDPEFWPKHGEWIETHPRVYGYGIWKPYLIQKKLATLQDGDILIYADCGCELNPKGLERFQDYLDVLEESDQGIISFQLPLLDRQFTKRVVLDYFQTDGRTGQYMSTMVLLKKTPHSVKIIEEWYKHMRYEWIDDTHSQEYPEFIDNRQDQHIYSMIVKKYGTITLPDETYYLDWSEGNHIPILAKRNRYF